MATEDPSSADRVLKPSVATVSDTTIVKVGAEGKRYNLHIDLLKHHSGYFRGALSGAFKETDDGIITLIDIDTDAFDVFVDWIYTGVVAPIEFPAKTVNHIGPKFRSYILADRLLAPGLKSAIMDLFVCYQGAGPIKIPGCHGIIYCYAHLPESDPLIRLVVDLWCFKETMSSMNDEVVALLPQLPKDFLVRYLVRMRDFKAGAASTTSLKREDYN
ncbi:hypothetical protein J4E80_007172 [Alternaria sp. BMP 0032]|nr:hypothetical protein J4E80_007172 [Alternaria sp. BMP 0032]